MVYNNHAFEKYKWSFDSIATSTRDCDIIKILQGLSVCIQ